MRLPMFVAEGEAARLEVWLKEVVEVADADGFSLASEHAEGTPDGLRVQLVVDPCVFRVHRSEGLRNQLTFDL